MCSVRLHVAHPRLSLFHARHRLVQTFDLSILTFHVSRWLSLSLILFFSLTVCRERDRESNTNSWKIIAANWHVDQRVVWLNQSSLQCKTSAIVCLTKRILTVTDWWSFSIHTTNFFNLCSSERRRAAIALSLSLPWKSPRRIRCTHSYTARTSTPLGFVHDSLQQPFCLSYHDDNHWEDRETERQRHWDEYCWEICSQWKEKTAYS